MTITLRPPTAPPLAEAVSASTPAPAPTRASLERAMANDELMLHYQPKVRLADGSIIGAEALVRWNDGQHGIMQPDDFLPVVTSSGLLHDLTLTLLDQVVVACQTLQTDHAGMSLSMNVAPDDLASNLISSRIGALLGSGAINSHDLQIEITESAVMGNVDRVRDDLERLNALGIKVLMDDFGTGYSSIDRLSQLPFDSLKLDQGVVKRMGQSRQSLEVVKSAISMARELCMTSVAEGIETESAYHFLIASGCEEAQGYFIARPMSLEHLQDFLRGPHDFEGSQIGRVHQAILNLLHFRKCLIDAAYCRQDSDGMPLSSVLDPEFSGDVLNSRVGLWYFGIGQRLAGSASFGSIEAPLRELHQAGDELMQRIQQGMSDPDVRQAMSLINARVNTLITLLHALEIELL